MRRCKDASVVSERRDNSGSRKGGQDKSRDDFELHILYFVCNTEHWRLFE